MFLSPLASFFGAASLFLLFVFGKVRKNKNNFLNPRYATGPYWIGQLPCRIYFGFASGPENMTMEDKTTIFEQHRYGMQQNN